MNNFREEDVVRSKHGTFATQFHTAGAMTLSFDTVEPDGMRLSKAEIAADFAAQARSRDPQSSRAAHALIIRQIDEFAHSLGRGNTLNEDQTADAIGEARSSLFETLASGKPVKRGLIMVVTMTKVAQALGAPLRHEDVKGLKVLFPRIEKEEIALGRPLTDKEIDTVADNVRENWPDKRHRPTIGFQYRRPGDQMIDTDVEGLRELENHASLNDDRSTSATSWEMAAKIRLEEHAATMETQKRPTGNVDQKLEQQYVAYANAYNLPQAARGSVTPERAAQHTRAVSGRVHIFAEQFLDGAETGPDADAFFAPFGRLQPVEKVRIAQALSEAPAHAERLWTSAMITARAKPARKNTRVAPAPKATADPWAQFAGAPALV
jgi:hypothetical protein